MQHQQAVRIRIDSSLHWIPAGMIQTNMKSFKMFTLWLVEPLQRPTEEFTMF